MDVFHGAAIINGPTATFPLQGNFHSSQQCYFTITLMFKRLLHHLQSLHKTRVSWKLSKIHRTRSFFAEKASYWYRHLKSGYHLMNILQKIIFCTGLNI